MEDSNLYVKLVHVDGGRSLKRLQTAPQGRAYRVRKRSNHVTLVLDSINKEVENTSK
jgi:large subunit ribosomal protein L22